MSLINDALKVAGGNKPGSSQSIHDIKPVTSQGKKNGGGGPWNSFAILGVLFLLGFVVFLIVKISMDSPREKPVAPAPRPATEVAEPAQPVAAPVPPPPQPVTRVSQPAQPVAAPVPPPHQPVTRVSQPAEPVAAVSQPAAIPPPTTPSPPPPPSVEEVENNYRVTIIVVGGETRSAVVNKHLVGIGDHLPGGAQVKDIQPRFVKIEIRGQEYFLTIQPL
jgi:hypothetical protein